MSIFLKTEDEIGLMRQANRLVVDTLSEIGRHIQPGVSTLFLDKIAEEYIVSHGGRPTFKNFPSRFGPPFPGSICASVNNIVVHGIPSDNVILREGDIVSIDCGALLNGFNGDSCYTFAVGEISSEWRRLLDVTKEALYLAIELARPGNHLGDIGAAVQRHCEAEGFGVVREFAGHGIGRSMHEEPLVHNYGRERSGLLLQEGMCLAIEPMITLGSRHIKLLEDKWSVSTIDHQPAAHFEHTIAIHRDGPEILSSFEGIENHN